VTTIQTAVDCNKKWRSFWYKSHLSATHRLLNQYRRTELLTAISILYLTQWHMSRLSHRIGDVVKPLTSSSFIRFDVCRVLTMDDFSNDC